MNHDISFNEIRTEELTHHLSFIMKKRASVVHPFAWENDPNNVERRNAILELADVVMDQLAGAKKDVYISYLLADGCEREDAVKYKIPRGSPVRRRQSDRGHDKPLRLKLQQPTAWLREREATRVPRRGPERMIFDIKY